MVKPKLTYIICATPRSGSHLLSEALISSNVAGKPDEYFIIDKEGRLQNETGNIAEQFGQKSLADFRELVLELGSTANGTFGIIIFWGYLHHIVRNYQILPEYQRLNTKEILDELFDNPKYIWLTRRDKVRQAVSLCKAMQTDVWRQSRRNQPYSGYEPVFNYESIEYWKIWLEEGDLSWQQFFNKHHIQYHKVIYEDLAKNYEKITLKILNFLGIAYPHGVKFEKQQIKKQSDHVNKKWISEYKKVKRAEISPIYRFWLKIYKKIRNVSLRYKIRLLLKA